MARGKPIYIKLAVEVAFGGQYSASTSWSAEKHPNVKVREEGSWIYFETPSGDVLEVPIFQVEYLKRSKDEPAKGKA